MIPETPPGPRGELQGGGSGPQSGGQHPVRQWGQGGVQNGRDGWTDGQPQGKGGWSRGEETLGRAVWSLVVCEKGGGGHKGDTSPAACPGPRGVGEALDVPVLQAAELLLQAGDALALLCHQRAQRRHLLQHLLQPPARLRTPRVTCQATPPPLGPAHHPRGHAHHPQSPAHHSRGHAHHPRGHAPSPSLPHSLPRRPRPFPKRPRPLFHRPRPPPEAPPLHSPWARWCRCPVPGAR